MNTPKAWQDEDIHALLDGELDADTARRLEADSQTDAVLAARIARQREVKRLLHARFDPVLDEAIPSRLKSTVDSVVPLAAARAAREASRPAPKTWGLREWGAIAASLFLGMLMTTVFRPGTRGLPLAAADGRLVADSTLRTALDQQASGATSGPVEVLLSFRATDGGLCRAFVLHAGAASAGLACRQAGHWNIELLEGTGTAPAADGYRQAASRLPAVLRTALEARGAAEPLAPDEESRQIAGGWDAPRP